MWRIASILCLTALAEEYTTQELDQRSSSIKSVAEKTQAKVVSLSKEIGTLASELYTIPGEVAKTHGVGEKADAMVRKKQKATSAKLCELYDSLAKVASAAEQESQDTKDTVDKVQAHVHHDPSNLAVAQQYMNYIAKFQSAKMILDAAATNAKTLTVPAGTLCKTTPELAASRLFLDTPAVPYMFHWPSALLGALGATAVGGAIVSFFRSFRSQHSATLMLIDSDEEVALE